VLWQMMSCGVDAKFWCPEAPGVGQHAGWCLLGVTTIPDSWLCLLMVPLGIPMMPPPAVPMLPLLYPCHLKKQSSCEVEKGQANNNQSLCHHPVVLFTNNHPMMSRAYQCIDASWFSLPGHDKCEKKETLSPFSTHMKNT